MSQIPDLNQMAGIPVPLVAGDVVVVVRNGVPYCSKVSAIQSLSAAQITAHNELATPHGATAAGMALLTAADLAAQKTILGIE